MISALDLDASFSRTEPVRLGGQSLRAPSIIDLIGEAADADEVIGLWEDYGLTYDRSFGVKTMQGIWATFQDIAVGEIAEQISSSRLILDLACGDGRIIDKLLTIPGARIIGCDMARSMLHGAQRRLAGKRGSGRVALWRMNLNQPWPWPDGAFGAATWNFGPQYLSRDDQAKAISEAGRVLSPGAVFFTSTYVKNRSFKEVVRPTLLKELREGNIWGVIRTMSSIPFTRKVDQLVKQGKMYHPSVEEIESMHRAAGFREFKVVHEFEFFGLKPAIITKSVR